MAQRQFRSDDTDTWADKYGDGSSDVTKSSNETASLNNAGCSGTSGTTSLTLDNASSFQNGDIVLIHQSRGTGVGNWELNKISSGAGTTSLTMTYNLMNSYVDSGASQAQIVGFIKAKNFTINSGVTVTVPSWDGSKGGIYPVLANGTITIEGAIACVGGAGGTRSGAGNIAGGTGCGFSGGLGDLQNGKSQGYCGEGTSGASANQRSANGNGAGGSSGNTSNGYFAPGSGAGHASNGSGPVNGGSATATLGTVGSSAGVASLVTMVLGGGGGGGGMSTGGVNNYSVGSGGAGGGLVILIGKTISLGSSSSISVNGGAGGPSTSGAYASGAGGGGGAAGSVLLKGESITLGTNKITATGGAGGSGGADNFGGGAGSSGRIHADYATSISGSTNPTIDSTNDTSLLSILASTIYLKGRPRNRYDFTGVSLG